MYITQTMGSFPMECIHNTKASIICDILQKYVNININMHIVQHLVKERYSDDNKRFKSLVQWCRELELIINNLTMKFVNIYGCSLVERNRTGALWLPNIFYIVITMHPYHDIGGGLQYKGALYLQVIMHPSLCPVEPNRMCALWFPNVFIWSHNAPVSLRSYTRTHNNREIPL